MRTIETVWFRGLAEKKFTWTVQEFCAELLNFLPLKLLPPKSVLNLYSMKGEIDWGMSGGMRWKPFELDEKEYEEVAANVADHRVSTDQEFKTEIDWEAFCYSNRLGVPEQQFKRLKQCVIDRENEWEKAKASESKERISRTYTEFMNASKSYRDFIRQYNKKRR